LTLYSQPQPLRLLNSETSCPLAQIEDETEAGNAQTETGQTGTRTRVIPAVTTLLEDAVDLEAPGEVEVAEDETIETETETVTGTPIEIEEVRLPAGSLFPIDCISSL
jgi:hypothetical protein